MRRNERQMRAHGVPSGGGTPSDAPATERARATERGRGEVNLSLEGMEGIGNVSTRPEAQGLSRFHVEFLTILVVKL